MEILPELANVDLVLTDPPYSDNTKNGSLTRDDDSVFRGKNFIPFSITEENLRDIISKSNSLKWTIVFADWRHVASFGINPPKGKRFVRFGVWNKPNGAPQFTGDRPAPGWEAIAIMHEPDMKMVWNGGGSRSVWTFDIEHQNGHPTPKPLKLMKKMIELFSNKNEIVLDPFMGSGTTLRAAKDLNRKAIGIEIEEKYCELAAMRLKQEVLQL